jgi:succinoglycan biosynthesis protein ExoV
MKLVYWQGPIPNFGDELNTYLWPRILPSGFLDADETELFLGIGSIIWDHLPAAPTKYIVGSGYGGYTPLPDVRDGSWEPIFVRGPRTASALGLPPELGICDSAVLLRLLEPPRKAQTGGTGFMPHFESIPRGFWREACQRAGLTFIDPTGDVESVLEQIAGLDMLITEAMHGAIVADALRTPWLAARPTHAEHQAKWLDWSEALDLKVRSHALYPTSALELYIGLTRGRRYYQGAATRWNGHELMRPANAVLTELAAARLRRIAREEPQLSNDANIARATTRAEEALYGFVHARAGARLAPAKRINP